MVSLPSKEYKVYPSGINMRRDNEHGPDIHLIGGGIGGLLE